MTYSNNVSEELFKEQLKNPISNGESAQVNRIRKLSDDPLEIIKFKKDLHETKDRLHRGLNEAPPREESQADLPKERHPPPIKPITKRRRFDSSILIRSKPGFFHVFFNIISIISRFRKRYGKQKKVQFSFINFFSNGSFFYPDPSILKFAHQKIIPLQNVLRPYLRSIYQWGWCDKKGKIVLNPFEFNLIADCERLMNSKKLEEAFYHWKDPSKAIETLNTFIQHYYTLIHNRDNFQMMLHNINKILLKIADAGINSINPQVIKKIEKLLKEFIDLQIEKRFLAPVFESHLGKPIIFSEIKKIIQLEHLSKTEYYADAKLLSAMKAKGEKYFKYLNEKIEKLQGNLELIDVIENDLEFKVQTKKEEFKNPLEHGIQKKYSLYKGFLSIDELRPHQKCFFITLYFIDTYDSFLLNKIKLKKDISKKTAVETQLFMESVFENELSFLMESINKLKRIAEKSYRGDIFNPAIQEREISKEHRIHLSTLNSIADTYFSIGEKIFQYFKGRKIKNEDNAPLFLSDLGKSVSFFSDHSIFLVSSKKDFNEGYYFFQKKVDDVLKEIRAFCFQYAYHFEYQFRKFQNDLPRTSTIRHLIFKKPELEKNLKTLEKDDDVDIL